MHQRILSTLTTTMLAAFTAAAALTDHTVQPACTEPVSALASVKITFPEAKFLGLYGSKLEGVTLTAIDDPSTVYEPCNISYSTFFASNSQTFSLRRVGSQTAEAITEPGRYLLHFPARCFELCGDWYEHLGYSDEIDIIYTVGGSGSGYGQYFDRADIGVRPMPGSVMEFRDITLSFPVSDDHPTIDIIDTNVITLTRADGSTEYTVAETLFNDEGQAAVTFRRSDSGYPHPEYIHEPGEYTVHIPAGVFRLTATDIVNPDMELHYTVTGANAASGQLARHILSPSPGTVDRIETIVLEYPDLDEPLSFPDGLTDVTAYLDGRVSLRRLEEDEDLCTRYIPCSARLLADNRIEMRFRNRVAASANPGPETISRTGDYQLTVLPNTFKLKSNTFAFNPRIEAHYTIDRDIPANTLSVYDLSPADGDRLGRITGGSIVFPEASDGLAYPIDRTLITLTNTDDPDDVYEARNLMLQGNRLTWGWNRPDFAYDERLTITREGTYRLEIREGAMHDYARPDNANPAISALIHVSPDNDFNYTLTPEPDRAYTTLTSITVLPAGGATGMRPAENADAPATLREARGTTYTLTCGEDCVFSLPETLPDGSYTLTIPAGYLVQTNRNGNEVSNGLISASYRLTRPTTFGASFIPPAGATVSGLRSVSVTPTGGSVRSLAIDRSAGEATLRGPQTDITLTPALSDYSVSFILPDDIQPAPGDYTLSIPAGYITVTDGNGLPSPLAALTATYTIAQTELPVFSGGIFLINEGAYGSDFGSVNYLEEDLSTMHYRVFSQANAGATPGVTTQYGCLHGDRLYMISKQASYTDPSSLLTIADSRTLKADRREPLSGISARSICHVGRGRLYIGAADGIHIYDPEGQGLAGHVEGTATGSNPYDGQTGDMVRMGRYVFAAVQGTGVRVIDPDGDSLVATIPVEGISGIFVTGGGHLFASSDTSGEPFVEINPETLEATPIATDAPAVASQWPSWRSLPLTASIRGNRIFYVAEPQTGRIASYDFDTSTFRADYISLPSPDGIQMKTYGTALSTEPETGYVVISATGGPGKYDHNALFFADPSDGHVIESMTVDMEPGYLFPAMAVHLSGSAPIISCCPSLSVTQGESSILDVAAMTYLSTGNPWLTIYSAESDNPGICSVERISNGRYTLSGVTPGTATITVTADYRGMTADTAITVRVTESAGIQATGDDDPLRDVYDLSGRCVLRNARQSDIDRLPHGFYITGGRKLIH